MEASSTRGDGVLLQFRDTLLKPQPAWVNYGIALSAVGLAFAAKLLSWPFGERMETPFITFFLAVVLSSWFGWRAGLVATVLSAVLSAAVFLPESTPFLIGGAKAFQLAVFCVEGLAIAALGGISRSAFDRRETIVEEEQSARSSAEEAARRLTLLQGLTAELAAVKTEAGVAQVVVERAIPALGADMGSLVTLDEARSRFHTLVRVAAAGEVMEGVDFSVDVPTPFADAVKTRKPVILGSKAERDARYPLLADEPTNQSQALVALPLLIDEHPIGALGFSLPAAGEIPREQVRLLEMLADQCALALERARLARQQREDHTRLDQSFQDVSALYDLLDGAVRAGTLDEIYEQTLSAIKRVLRTDRAAVLLFEDRGVMSFVAWEGLSDEYRAAVQGHTPWPRTETNPRSVLFEDALQEPNLRDLHEVIEKEGYRALAFIPLVYRGTLIGKLMLYYDAPHSFSDREVRLAEIIANKTALAIRRKSAEEALEHSDLRYRSLFERNYDAIFSFDLEGRFTSLNEKVEEITGYSRQELMGRSFEKLVVPERLDETLDTFRKVVQGEQRMLETKLRRKDGRLVDVNVTGMPIIISGNVVEGVFGIARDVTEKREAETALRDTLTQLREQQQRVDDLVGNVPGVVWEAWGEPDAANQRIDFVSDHVEEMLGYSVEEWLGTPNFWLQIVHPDDKERAAAEAAAIFAGGKGGQSRFRWIAKDGRVVHVDAHSRVITDDDGRPAGMRGVTIDVSAQRNAETQLELVMDNVPALISYVGANLHYTFANRSYKDWFGEDPAGRHLREVLGEDAYESIRVYLERALAGETVTYDTLIPYRQGGARYVQATYVPDKSADGTVQGFIALVTDISERRRAEERFTRAFQASPAAISITRGRDRMILDVNDSFCAVTGYSKEDLVGKQVDDIGLWETPAARDEFADRIAREGRVRNLETRIRGKDGSLRQTLGSAEVISVDGDDCVLALFYDITERKRFEEQLREVAARTSAVLNTAVDGIITIDEHGAIESVNPAVERLFGYKKSELIGENISVLMPEPYHTEHDGYLRSYLTTGEKKIIGLGREVEGKRKDGTTFPMDLSVSEVALDGARIFTGIVHDITARKEAEMRLSFLAQASERLSGSLDYITVLRELAAIVVPALADWCAVDVLEEDGAIRRLVVTHGDPAKGETARLLEQRYVRRAEDMLQAIETLSQGRTMLVENFSEGLQRVAVVDEAHEQIMQELGFQSAMMLPILSRERLTGTITLVTSAESGRRYDEDDVAFAEEVVRRAALSVENARLFTESQRVQHELRLSNEQKDEFLGMVSHELRTPVTVINGGATMLLKRGESLSTDDRAALLVDIERESHRLRRLVEDMLVLARLELQPASVILEPVSLERVVGRVVNELMQRAPGQRLEARIERELPLIAADETYVEQVLRNLLTNAMKYASNKPVEVVARRNGGSEVLVSVMDRGPGLRTDQLEQVFERFYRSDQTGTVGGTGMGLTVCKRLVEAQSGKIWAEGRKGGGLTVAFSLPFYSDPN